MSDEITEVPSMIWHKTNDEITSIPESSGKIVAMVEHQGRIYVAFQFAVYRQKNPLDPGIFEQVLFVNSEEGMAVEPEGKGE